MTALRIGIALPPKDEFVLVLMEEILRPILQVVAKRDFRDRRLDQHFERHDVDALQRRPTI